MKNSYDDDASADVPYHLFGWAVGDEQGAPDIATRVITESSKKQQAKQQRLDEHVRALNEMSDFGTTVVRALEEVGFNAEFELLTEGRVKLTYDDADGVYTGPRRRVANGVVGRLVEASGGKILGMKCHQYLNGGDITVGLMSGIGFGGMTGLDPSFDPFESQNIQVVSEMDVNVDDKVLDRIDELTGMWTGDYEVYNEGVELTLNEMDTKQRDTLALWIEGQTSRIGVPGSTLEEVLYDVHRRIRRMRRR